MSGKLMEKFYKIFQHKIWMIEAFSFSKIDSESDGIKKLIREEFSKSYKLCMYVDSSQLFEIKNPRINFRFVICVENEFFFKNNFDLICRLLTITHYFINTCKSKKINNSLIIWIPIQTKRDFKYKTISDSHLEKCNNDFKAFTTSGLTIDYGEYKVCIVTRMEEIQKLLIHELIHNVDIDMRKHKMIKHYYRAFKKVKTSTIIMFFIPLWKYLQNGVLCCII